jgi:hypothetical protein
MIKETEQKDSSSVDKGLVAMFLRIIGRTQENIKRCERQTTADRIGRNIETGK